MSSTKHTTHSFVLWHTVAHVLTHSWHVHCVHGTQYRVYMSVCQSLCVSMSKSIFLYVKVYMSLCHIAHSELYYDAWALWEICLSHTKFHGTQWTVYMSLGCESLCHKAHTKLYYDAWALREIWLSHTKFHGTQWTVYVSLGCESLCHMAHTKLYYDA